MFAIRLSSVCKYWEASKAVDNISFELEKGKLLVLLGPSGCGKSTTLRLIAGLENVTSGQIFIDDCDVTGLPPSKRRLSMVFQSYALFPHLTVRENILFGLKIRKVSYVEQEKRLKRAIDILSLDGLLERKPSMLSGGQQQRVALGRALVAEASVCLMDEPLSNLDAKLRNDMRKEIREIQQQIGMTMVYVTHDQTEAMSMADQVILMEKGCIVQQASPAEMYAKPQTIFAASFIGTPPMNLLSLAKEHNHTYIKGSKNPLTFSPPSGALILGVRPENISVFHSGWNSIVTKIEYQGGTSLITCKIGSESVMFIQSGVAQYCVGDNLFLHCDQKHLHFFHAETGVTVS